MPGVITQSLTPWQDLLSCPVDWRWTRIVGQDGWHLTRGVTATEGRAITLDFYTTITHLLDTFKVNKKELRCGQANIFLGWGSFIKQECGRLWPLPEGHKTLERVSRGSGDWILPWKQHWTNLLKSQCIILWRFSNKWSHSCISS